MISKSYIFTTSLTAQKKDTEVSDKDFEAIGIVPDKFHGEWNYRIEPMMRIGISL